LIRFLMRKLIPANRPVALLWLFALSLLFAIDMSGGFKSLDRQIYLWLSGGAKPVAGESLVFVPVSGGRQDAAISEVLSRWQLAPLVISGKPERWPQVAGPLFVRQRMSLSSLSRLAMPAWAERVNSVMVPKQTLETEVTAGQQLIPIISDDVSRLFTAWRDQWVLSASGYLLLQNSAAKPQWTWQGLMSGEDGARPLGVTGEIQAREVAPRWLSLAELSDGPPPKNANIVLVDAVPSDWMRAVAKVESIWRGHYAAKTTLAIAIKFLFWLFIWFGLWRMVGDRPGRNAVLVAAALFTLLVSLYLLQLNQHWFDPAALLLGLGLSYGLGSLNWQQHNQQRQWQARVNELLRLTLPVMYHERKLEKLQPLLFATNPDQKLADCVFDIALQAEAQGNHGLSKRLLSWIESSGLKHPDTQQKLEEIRAAEANAALDSTLVISPGQMPPRNTLSHVLPVKAFGRYQVEGVLGKGAMGVVYQGVDPKINRHVAIKTLALNEYEDADDQEIVRERFFREAETAGNLSHANIVTIYDVGEEGDLAYIAMDLLTGAPLSNFVKPGSLLPPALVYQLMIQIADALAYAHSHQVVHRDVKPANMIYDDDIQRVTITDFGIAYVADNSKTRTGTIVGSPYYMSPEQIKGLTVDARSDIFSLGATFYQLLTGQLPFAGESIASVAFHITETEHKSVRKINPKLPASAVRITNKAMQKDPDDRYQSMAEMRQALINALKRDFKKEPLG